MCCCCKVCGGFISVFSIMHQLSNCGLAHRRIHEVSSAPSDKQHTTHIRLTSNTIHQRHRGHLMLTVSALSCLCDVWRHRTWDETQFESKTLPLRILMDWCINQNYLRPATSSGESVRRDFDLATWRQCAKEIAEGRVRGHVPVICRKLRPMVTDRITWPQDDVTYIDIT